MAIKLNVEPYYDDFETATAVDGLSPKEKYNQILFRPGHAVQARELTQIQSILQNQVNSMGNHLFKEGAMVIPGGISYENYQDFVKLATSSAASLTSLKGKVMTGGTSGVTAKVVAVAAAAGSDPDTLYLKYQTTGTSQAKEFAAGETLTADSGGFTATTAASAATGFGSLAFISEGIYYIKGKFVIVQSQELILNKYTSNASYDVGLTIDESIVTPAADATLNDNANGTSNYAAPGAHRYQIKTTLSKQAVEGTTIDDFLLLLRIVNGVPQKFITTTDYNIIEETLARRTFDESGNYAVRPFLANIKEHTEINTPGDNTKLSIGVEPSKAYVRGYEIETLATRFVNINKARSTSLLEATSTPMVVGNYVNINNVEGIPDITTFSQIEIRNAVSGGGSIIGFARARSIVYAGSSTYRVYLFDIQMNSAQLFNTARSLRMAGTPEFKGDLVLVGTNAVINEPQRNKLVFPLPFSRVKTCDSQPDGVADDFNYVYFSNREFSAQTVSGGQVTFGTVGTNELFEPFDNENWILTIATGTGNGTNVSLSSSDVNIQTGSESVIISNLSAYNTQTVKLVAGVKRTLEHKQKSLTTSGSPNLNLFPVSVQSTVESGDMQLGHADGYKLRAVYMAADFSTAATITDTDVSEYYDFDNGHRDNFYAPARIKLKTNTAFRPTGQLLIKYEYFTHVGAGDFFSVDSYSNLVDSEGVAVSYEDIPSFTSKNTGEVIELRSAIDFRPRQSNAGNNFSGTGASVGFCPEPLTTFTTDLQFYLNRMDKVFLDKVGKFGVVEGVPAIEPELPEDPKDAMILYHLSIPAYTLSPEEVGIKIIDNKRYTMRDIGKLERRLNRIEYFTSLSLLEKEAAGKEIIDPTTLTTRQKAGFITDSFASHNVGDVTNSEYRAAIDRDRRLVRPMFSEDNVRLMYSSALSSNVQKTGALVTLPYTQVSLFNQSQASSFINVNPYDVFSWTGTLELSPTSDEWKDTSRRPNVIVDQEGVFDAMLGIIDETNALGTVWGEWQTNWTGTPVITERGGQFTQGNRIFQRVTESFDEGQSRRGVETSVVPETITTDIGDRVVEVNFAPFVRSRIINFKATRMKPNTTVYAFFDGVSVANFVREESSFTTFEDTDNGVVNGSNTITAHPSGATALSTDAQGEVIGSFFVPNNPTTRFQTGTRIFKLTDNSTNNDALTSTSASEAYHAKGLIETKENVTISTRVPRIERREVTDDRIVPRQAQSSEFIAWRQENDNRGWGDPLAQSFMIDVTGGAFITSVDLFFHTKDSSIPVTVQLREMENGIPTPRIIPFGEVTVNAADINVVDLTVSNPDPNQVTTFTFPSPVYLQENVEYCFVVMANTNEYQVWYSEIGEDNYITGERISKQPYAGVMFLSQNASTWTPDQNKDLKFNLKRADFDIASTGQVVLQNASTLTRQLVKNPFETTSGSNTVRVSHPNHHFFETTNSISSSVTITGAVAANGIPASELNGTHVVSNIEMDSYTITLTTNATGTGIAGGSNVTATENQKFDTFYPFIQQLNFPGTNSTYGVRLSSGMSLGQTSPTPYVTSTSFSPIIVNQNYRVDRPKVIASDDNEQAGKTMFIRGSFTSTRDNISPVIDLERCSVFTIANRIDNPAATGAAAPFNIVSDFVAETGIGSAAAKYLTKIIKLTDAADGINVYIDINRPSNTFIDLYYKANNTEEDLETSAWTLATPLEAIQISDGDQHREVKWEIDPTGLFSVFQLKLVFRTTNSSRVPTARDLRAIAVLP